MLYYIFETEDLAIGAERYISQIGGAPIVGINAETLLEDYDGVKTERWAIPKQRKDGKWVFPYVGDERIAQYPTDVANYFETTYPNTKEEFSDDWFDVIDDE